MKKWFIPNPKLEKKGIINNNKKIWVEHMTENFFKSSGKKSLSEVLSIMDPGKKASTSGKGSKSKAPKTNDAKVSTKKMKV